MTEKQQGWTIEGRDVFIDRWSVDGLETMTREEAQKSLNEHETLKEENEVLREFVGLIGNMGEEAYALLKGEKE